MVQLNFRVYRMLKRMKLWELPTSTWQPCMRWVGCTFDLNSLAQLSETRSWGQPYHDISFTELQPANEDCRRHRGHHARNQRFRGPGEFILSVPDTRCWSFCFCIVLACLVQLFPSKNPPVISEVVLIASLVSSSKNQIRRQQTIWRRSPETCRWCARRMLLSWINTRNNTKAINEAWETPPLPTSITDMPAILLASGHMCYENVCLCLGDFRLCNPSPCYLRVQVGCNFIPVVSQC